MGDAVAPLILGTAVPIATVLLAPDVGHLAELYAIGVVGAIAINLSTCATNFELHLHRVERILMGALAAFMLVVW